MLQQMRMHHLIQSTLVCVYPIFEEKKYVLLFFQLGERKLKAHVRLEEAGRQKAYENVQGGRGYKKNGVFACSHFLDGPFI